MLYTQFPCTASRQLKSVCVKVSVVADTSFANTFRCIRVHINCRFCPGHKAMTTADQRQRPTQLLLGQLCEIFCALAKHSVCRFFLMYGFSTPPHSHTTHDSLHSMLCHTGARHQRSAALHLMQTAIFVQWWLNSNLAQDLVQQQQQQQQVRNFLQL